MQIQAGETWNLKHITGKNLSISEDDNHIRCQPADLVNDLQVFDFCGLKNRRAAVLAKQRFLYRRRLNVLLASDRLIGLSDDCNEFMLRI